MLSIHGHAFVNLYRDSDDALVFTLIPAAIMAAFRCRKVSKARVLLWARGYSTALDPAILRELLFIKRLDLNKNTQLFSFA